MEKKILYAVISGMFIVIISVIGVVYAGINDRIDKKADMAVVELIREDAHETRLMMESHIAETGFGKIRRKR